MHAVSPQILIAAKRNYDRARRALEVKGLLIYLSLVSILTVVNEKRLEWPPDGSGGQALDAGRLSGRTANPSR
jgi:hypothetical protein